MIRSFAEIATDSSTTTDKLAPVHSGEILMEDFMAGVASPPTRHSLGRYFAMDAQIWINLQSHNDLEVEMDALRD